MRFETYVNINLALCLIILLLLEGLCLWGLWKVIASFWVWVSVSVVVFFIVSWLAHRLIPRVTWPIVDALIGDKVER